MGIYTRYISTIKAIDSIKIGVQNTLKDVDAVWTFINGKKKLLFPDIIVNLSGAQSYEKSIIWPAGIYKVEIQAGANFATQGSSNSDYVGRPGKIVTEISISEPFYILAYSGSKATTNSDGINPYSGPYKCNAFSGYENVPPVTHIFGNCGGSCRTVDGGGNHYHPGGPNCLGNGAYDWSDLNNYGRLGAGSCIHFIPINGVFGQDFLFAAHCCPGTYSSLINVRGGSIGQGGGNGSAYGGSGSGMSSNYTLSSASYNGGNTPYGNGGPGVPIPSVNPSVASGNNGTGIGAGLGGGLNYKNINGTQYRGMGAACFFDGQKWNDSNTVGEYETDGFVRVQYIE